MEKSKELSDLWTTTMLNQSTNRKKIKEFTKRGSKDDSKQLT